MYINIDKITASGEVHGYILFEEATLEMQALFTGETINVVGEYSIRWDDDIPMPFMHGLLAYEDDVTFDISEDLYNVERVEDAISNSGYDSEWAEDRAGSMSDYAHDSMDDR